MRQMRLEKREIKDPAELEKVLDACKVVRIGTMDAEGMFIVPVNFGYEFCQKERSLIVYPQCKGRTESGSICRKPERSN